MQDDMIRMEKLGDWAAVWSTTRVRRVLILLGVISVMLLAFAPLMPGGASLVSELAGWIN